MIEQTCAIPPMSGRMTVPAMPYAFDTQMKSFACKSLTMTGSAVETAYYRMKVRGDLSGIAVCTYAFEYGHKH